eukprot:204807_1
MFVYVFSKHQYLAFDVSLPPPNYLSCSPKQLDSGTTFTNYVKRVCSVKIRCVCIYAVRCIRLQSLHKTWLSHSMAVVKLQKDCFPALNAVCLCKRKTVCKK